jgi:chemotaxis protein histidine kinase CheA
MNQPLGAADFFALEAGETLDRLDGLVSGPAAPSGDDLLRATRVLRGAALMASQQPIARAAGGLEAFARALRDGQRQWDPAAREQVAQAIEEFRLLVRRTKEWGEGESTRAARLTRALEALGGIAPADGERREAGGPIDAGIRAFVAREGALIASALDRAARAFPAAPGDREPLYAVIRRMQSLRGLAELGELSPLPEMLDAIELAIGDLTRLFAPPPGVEEVMAAGAAALTRIARDVAGQGRPEPDAEEARRFTELLVRAFAVERDVVPIESLFPDDEAHPVTPPPTQPQFAAPAPLGPLELVSHGEHLCQIADLIAGAGTPIERDLRLYQLLGALRATATPGPDPVAGALAVFARSTREALAAGVAAQASEALTTGLRDAGELLRSVVDAQDRMQVSRRVLDVAHRVDLMRGGAGEPEGDIVPIESLAYDEAPAATTPAAGRHEPEPVAIESLAPDGGLETSYRTLGRLLRERAPVPASLHGLLGQAEAAAAPRAPQDEALAIEALCYRGRAALERAADVRRELMAALQQGRELAAVRPLVEELLDLLPLALADA